MSFFRELRFALRHARKNALFTLVVVATLALCIGANSAVLSIVDTALLRALPYPGPERLALVERRLRSPRGESDQTSHSGRTWETLSQGVTSMDLAVYSGMTNGVNFALGDHVQLVRQQRVGEGFFRVLGVPPLLGRDFSPEEDRAGGPSVVLLSHELWSRLWDRDPSVVGTTVLLRGEPHTVIGVLPPGLRTHAPADVWTPLRPSPTGEGSGTNYQILGRLRESASWERAEAEIGAVGGTALAEMRLPSDVEARFGIVDLQEGRARDVQTPILLLWAAVGAVLLIGCVNVAGMLLAKGAERTREIGTRLAIGGGRGAVLRQLLTESLLYGALGGAAGIALGKLALTAVKSVATDALSFLAFVELDARIVAGTVALTLLACILFGALPAIQTSRLDVRTALAEARGGAGPGRQAARRALVVGQVALSVLLLVAATLLLRSFQHLWTLEPGFDSRNLLSATISLQDSRYATRERVRELYRDTLDRVESVPGVETAAWSLGLPYERRLNMPFAFEGESLDDPRLTTLSYVTPGFFETLRIPLLRGRPLTDADDEDAPEVVVVNRAFVERYLDGSDAVGARLVLAGGTREIVGIVGDVQQRPSWGSPAPLGTLPAAYLPLAQTNDDFLELVHTWFSSSLTVRASGIPASLRESVREVVAATDPLLPVASFRTVEEVKAGILAFPHLLAHVLAGFAALAALLTVVGIYGIVSQAVTARGRELSIRMAVGATVAQTIGTVVRPSLKLAAIGMALGCALAWLAAPALQGFLWGVAATDPATIAGVIVGVLLAALVASMVPASRIARLSPAQRLREE